MRKGAPDPGGRGGGGSGSRSGPGSCVQGRGEELPCAREHLIQVGGAGVDLDLAIDLGLDIASGTSVLRMGHLLHSD